MVYAINNANEKYRKAQVLNSWTARLHGVDKVIEYSPRDIESNFYNSNREIFACERGNGYWLWKLLVHCAEKVNTDIIVFSISEKHLERMWSKRDTFIIMGCDSAEHADTPQRFATFLF